MIDPMADGVGPDGWLIADFARADSQPGPGAPVGGSAGSSVPADVSWMPGVARHGLAAAGRPAEPRVTRRCLGAPAEATTGSWSF
jgi:hypothetical protein